MPKSSRIPTLRPRSSPKAWMSATWVSTAASSSTRTRVEPSSTVALDGRTALSMRAPA
ncbi:MAG: hypothetical protein R3A52_04985 [Polyangiales bacterium]